MRLIISSVFLGVALAAYAVAAQPVASVTGFSSFDLDGNRVNVAGVPSWTVMSGDDIAAGASSLTVLFRDGSRITLTPYAHLRIDSAGGGVSANLVSGSMQFTLVSNSVKVLKSGGLVSERSGSASTGRDPGTVRPMLLRPPPPPVPVSSR